MDIIIKGMAVDGRVVQVPAGFSELINRAGAWSILEIPPLSEYRREIKRVDGRLVTELIYVGDAS